MNKEFNIEDIYIGLECRDEYSEFLEEYELWERYVLLKKTNLCLSTDNIAVEMYKNIDTNDRLYIDQRGYVVNSKDEITGEDSYHQIKNIISLKDLLEKFEVESREDSQYREYIVPIYQRVLSVLKNKKNVTTLELNIIAGNLNDIHSYVFGLISEEEYDDLFGCKVYNFNTVKMNR